MKVELIEKYCCPECEARYDEEFDAGECCPPDIPTIYICSICAEEFDYYKLAEQHIATPHAASPPSTPEEKYFDALLFSDAHPIELQQNILLKPEPSFEREMVEKVLLDGGVWSDFAINAEVKF